MRIPPILLCAVCALVAFASPSPAQVVRGTVVDAAGAPVRGAFVSILNEQGQQRTAVLSGVGGEFVFLMPAGRYSLRAELIGHQTATVAAFDLRERDTRTERIVMAVNALKLPEITVSGANRCSRMEASRETARVWNEARKVLTVAAWVGNNANATFRWRRSERTLDENLKDIGAPSVTFQATSGQRVFVTANPDSLARLGYVQDRPDGTFLFGPDAELLLSHSFLNQHCFGLRRSNDRRGMIGLTFQPLGGSRTPDISGVLWLDEQTAALRFIEYGFTNVRYYDDRRYAGGRTEFQQLPNGAWIVNRWYIRAPTLVRAGGVVRANGSFETGGEVLDAQVGAGDQVALAPRVALEGIVYDSVRGLPLAGARVYVSGTPFFSMAGADGRFRIDSIPVGQYSVSFEHPSMNSLPVLPSPVTVHADSMGVANLQLWVPSINSMMEQVCPAPERRRFSQASQDTSGTNRGVVYGAVNAGVETFRDLEVGLTWRRYYSLSQSTVTRLNELTIKPHSVAVNVEPNGRYTICSVPMDHPMTIDLSLRRRLVQRDSLRVGFPGLVRRDFILPERR